jgi:hypothetical protein
VWLDFAFKNSLTETPVGADRKLRENYKKWLLAVHPYTGGRWRLGHPLIAVAIDL